MYEYEFEEALVGSGRTPHEREQIENARRGQSQQRSSPTFNDASRSGDLSIVANHGRGDVVFEEPIPSSAR